MMKVVVSVGVACWDSAVKLVCEDPVFNLDDKYFLTREEAYDRAMEKSVHYIKKCRELDLDDLEKEFLQVN